jgi:hypothetical protein
MTLKKLIRESYTNSEIKYEYKKGPLEEIKNELKDFLSFSYKELVTPLSLSHAISPPSEYTISDIREIPTIPGGKVQFMETRISNPKPKYHLPTINFIYLEGSPEEDLEFIREIITKNNLQRKLE